MLRKISNNFMFLFVVHCLISCNKPNKIEQTFLIEQNQNTGEANDIISYKQSNSKDNYFTREEVRLSRSNDCIKSLKKENFKLVDKILFIKEQIEDQDIWYPYLLLKTGKCISFSEVKHFGTFITTNCLIDYKNEVV